MYMPKVVLGGGLTGMIASFVLKCPILEGSKKENDYDGSIGGKEDKLGLYYLHTSNGMDSLLYTLKLKVDVTEVRGGAIWSKVPIDFKDMPFEQREEIVEAYCDKTRGTPYNTMPISNKLSIMDGVLSDEEPWRYNVTFSQLSVALYRAVGNLIIYGVKVKKIDFRERVIINTSCAGIEYGEVFSTLPLKDMFDYAPALQTIGGYCFTFLVQDYGLPEDYDYLYLPGQEYTATRIIFPHELNSSVDKNIVYLETGDRDLDKALDDIAKLGCNNAIATNRVGIKDKRLIGDSTDYIANLEEGNCYLLGRNARWNDNLMINDVADEVMRLGNHFTNI